MDSTFDSAELGLYEAALIIYGRDRQIMQLFEEMAELQHAICRTCRGRINEGIIEELVDVQIMLNQMRVQYDRTGAVFEAIKTDKLNRLKNWLEREE